MVATIGVCFVIQIFLAKPDVCGGCLGPAADFAAGLVVHCDRHPGRHGDAAQSLSCIRPWFRPAGSAADAASKSSACRYYLLDAAIALNVAFFVNAAILIVSAAVFGRRGLDVTSIEEAHKLLPTFLGQAAPILFGVALLCAGQSSTWTGTLAGQIVMEGYLSLRMAPWLRRLITRLIALVPAVVVIALAGEDATQRLLILSQVVLSLQLSFAVIPLIHFTSNRRNMGAFATPWWGQIAGVDRGRDHRVLERQAGPGPDSTNGLAALSAGAGHVGPIPLYWLAAAGLYGTVGAALLLLLWVTIKPFVRPSPAWLPKPSVKLNWGTDAAASSAFAHRRGARAQRE